MTLGTRGDVQPFVALARGLAEAGHDAVVAAPRRFADLVGGAGVAFAGIDDGPLRLLDAGVLGEVASGGLRARIALARRLPALFGQVLDDCWTVASQGADVVVHNGQVIAGQHVAERLGRPAVLGLPIPMFVPTREFPWPGQALPAWLPGSLNRASYLGMKGPALAFARTVDRWRAAIGLSRRPGRHDPLRAPDGAPTPVLHAVSRHILPRPADWPQSAEVTGYWFLDSPSGRDGSAAAGVPPEVGLSSGGGSQVGAGLPPEAGRSSGGVPLAGAGLPSEVERLPGAGSQVGAGLPSEVERSSEGGWPVGAGLSSEAGESPGAGSQGGGASPSEAGRLSGAQVGAGSSSEVERSSEGGSQVGAGLSSEVGQGPGGALPLGGALPPGVASSGRGLSAELAAFLDAGAPPVFVGFGSMSGPDPAATTATVVRAARAVGVRVVLGTGWGGLAAEQGPDVFAVAEAPFDRLFPRVAAVVHHGGAGTVAAAAAAGRPQVVCPFVGDQPFWGRRLHRLGVAPAPIDQRALDADRLAAAIEHALSAEVADRAAELGARVRAERGVETAVARLEAIVRR
ncbi:glycosyltransferase, MGT family [Actinokineospora sp. UTMC 2448]|nr:glycosyltransferase, MGT family [Actinokineospora sp. UTMC 2448]